MSLFHVTTNQTVIREKGVKIRRDFQSETKLWNCFSLFNSPIHLLIYTGQLVPLPFAAKTQKFVPIINSGSSSFLQILFRLPTFLRKQHQPGKKETKCIFRLYLFTFFEFPSFLALLFLLRVSFLSLKNGFLNAVVVLRGFFSGKKTRHFFRHEINSVKKRSVHCTLDHAFSQFMRIDVSLPF